MLLRGEGRMHGAKENIRCSRPGIKVPGGTIKGGFEAAIRRLDAYSIFLLGCDGNGVDRNQCLLRQGLHGHNGPGPVQHCRQGTRSDGLQ